MSPEWAMASRGTVGWYPWSRTRGFDTTLTAGWVVFGASHGDGYARPF